MHTEKAAHHAEPSGLEARMLATRALKAVVEAKQPFDEAFAAMAATPAFSHLAPRDRAFARAIAVVTLRRYGQIEALLCRFLDRPLPESAREVHLILAMATAQLLFLNVAPHAAIGLAVEQIKLTPKLARLSALANAVLRNLERAHSAGKIHTDTDADRNTPPWLFQRWSRAHGEEAARRIAKAHLLEPPLDLCAKDDPIALAERLGGIVTLTGGVRLKHKGRIEDIDGYAEGAFWVQDAAAQIPAQLLGEVRGARVADLCAAPGGKTAQLAAKGAKVTAVDISPARLNRLRENMARLGFAVELVNADAGQWRPDGPFDAVLLDAPCTATGTLRRNPDIALLKTPADVEKLAAVQKRLLENAARLIRPGGLMVFCICSLEPEEGEDQIGPFLAAHPDFELKPIAPSELAYPEAMTPRGTLRTLPFFTPLGEGHETGELSGMDGFFAARFVKAR